MGFRFGFGGLGFCVLRVSGLGPWVKDLGIKGLKDLGFGILGFMVHTRLRLRLRILGWGLRVWDVRG